jgi:outer membrane protein TolC
MTVLALGVAFVAGCDAYLPGPSYSDVKVPPEKLRQIETLGLEEARPEPVQVPEPNATAAGEIELSIEQCRAIALENSLELKAVLINPTIAAEWLSVEEAKFESTFFANIDLSKTSTPSISYLDQISGSDVDALRSDLGVQVPLRTGGTVTFDVIDTRVETNAEFTQFNPYYSSDLSASISQPLLRNAGKWVNTHSIRIASYDLQITDAQTKLDVMTILATLDRVYWRLYAARRELEVRKQQHDLAQAQLQQARRLVNVGERAQVEIIRAEAGVAQQLEAIIVAENSLRDRERDLKRVMSRAGLEMQTPTVIVPTTEPDPVRYELDRARLVQTALDGRMELLQLELQLVQDASSIDVARNQTLPLATLGYTYNINGLGATRGDSFDLLFDNDFADHRVGLQVRVPLGNKAAEGRLRNAIYQRRAKLATRASRKATIESEVLSVADRVEANWQRILAARQNTILQGRLYDAEKRQFELGARTSTDVLDAQTSFANAQSAEINALAEYQISLVDLAYATGTVLGAARIQWEPIVPATR